MTRLLHVAALATTLTSAPASAHTAPAHTTYSCGQGTVRAVQAIDETVTRTTLSTRRDDDGEPRTFVTSADTTHHRSYVLTVQLKDRLYTSESPGDPTGTLDPLRIVAGDAIGICVSSAQMIVERPDGTDYRAPVVRQALAPVPVVPRGTR